MLVPQAIHATIPQFGPVFRTLLQFCQQRFAPVFMCCLGRANSALSLCWRRQLCYFPCLACYGSPCHARAPAPTRTGWLQADRVKTAPTLFGYCKDETRSLTTCSDWMLLPKGHWLLFWRLTTKSYTPVPVHQGQVFSQHSGSWFSMLSFNKPSKQGGN